MSTVSSELTTLASRSQQIRFSLLFSVHKEIQKVKKDTTVCFCYTSSKMLLLLETNFWHSVYHRDQPNKK